MIGGSAMLVEPGALNSMLPLGTQRETNVNMPPYRV
jgi:hypothetical protein